MQLKDTVLETMNKFQNLSIKQENLIDQFKEFSGSTTSDNWYFLKSVHERIDEIIGKITKGQQDAERTLAAYINQLDLLLVSIEKEEARLAEAIERFKERN